MYFRNKPLYTLGIRIIYGVSRATTTGADSTRCMGDIRFSCKIYIVISAKIMEVKFTAWQRGILLLLILRGSPATCDSTCGHPWRHLRKLL